MTLASFETIKNLRSHPNADRLEFATVLGYDCLVPKGKFGVGQRVVLIQPDTVLPDRPWTQTYLKFCRTRVKAMKLRGEWSFGIVEDPATFPELPLDATPDEVAATLEITKYDPPVPQDLSALGPLPFMIPKTDEERWQNLEALPFGEMVDVTLKIDGQSCSYYCARREGEWRFGVLGRTLEFKAEAANPFTAHVKRYGIEERLRVFCERHGVGVCLRGESYGQGIQSSGVNPHSKLESGWAMFGVWLMDDMRIPRRGDPFYFLAVANELGLPTVPVLDSGVAFTPELLQRYDSGATEHEGRPFEGVVVITATYSFKIINKHYDSLK
jgi:RNA ligase (TIGR02306 family)